MGHSASLPDNNALSLRSQSAGHSALAPENFTTLPNRSVSAAKNFANSAGDVANAEEPSSASRALIFGSARPALISLFSLSTISGGVPRGAPMPYTDVAS